MIENGPDNWHQERMLEVCASKECLHGIGYGCIAILPYSSVYCIHKLSLTTNRRHWQTATKSLPVGDNIRLHAKQRLRAAQMHAEACDNLIKDEGYPGFGREFSQLL